MANYICKLENNYIFSNVMNYYATYLWQLIAKLAPLSNKIHKPN